MFVLIDLVNWLLSIYIYILIASAVFSWLVAFGVLSFSNPNVRQASQVLRQLTDPVLNPIRRFLPPIGGMDLSPIVLFLVIQFVQRELNVLLVRAFYG
jgi:YggT family protein